MPSFSHFTLLEDAYFFLNQAKSLSDTPAARSAKQRYIRSCVVFSWQALEDATKDVLKRLAKPPVPSKLSEKLKLALSLKGKSHLFDANAYQRFYRLRNDTVHANASAPEPKVQDAETTFAFCKGMISLLATYELTLRIESF